MSGLPVVEGGATRFPESVSDLQACTDDDAVRASDPPVPAEWRLFPWI
jgi:hypothetical protein